MKKRLSKLILFIFFLFILSTKQAVCAENYTIIDLLSIALKKAEKVRIAEENIKISEEFRNKALAGFLPTITAFGRYTQYSESKIVNSQIVQPDDSRLWGITIEERLSLGGREFIAYSSAKDSLKKTEFEVNSLKEQYLLKVAQDIYGYLKAKRVLEIAEANLERIRKHRDAARIRLKVGEVTKTDVLRAEAELSGAEAEVIAAKNSLRIAKSTLAKDVGIEGNFEVLEQKLNDPYSALSFDDIRAFAKEQRVEIKAAMLSKEISKKNVNYATSSFFPYFSLTATYQRLHQDPSNQFTNRESKYAIASINFPIFEGGLRKAELSEAKAKLRQAELHYEDTVKEILNDVESAYYSYLTFRDTLKSLIDEVTYARENFNSVSKQYQHGLANSIDVTDANTFLVTAEKKLMEAQYSYQLSIIRLRQATGTLLKALINSEIVSQEINK